MQNNKFKGNKWHEKTIKEAILILNQSKTVSEAAKQMDIHERKLRRIFQKYKMMSPASYLLVQPELTKNQKKNIIALYSDFDGQGKTVSEIAEILKEPESKIQEYLKSVKITHKSLPFTEEDKKKLDPKLIEKAEEIREYKLKTLLEQKQRETERVDAQKWKSWKDNVGEKIFELVEYKASNYMVDKWKFPGQPVRDFCAILSLQDFHLGRLAHASEVKDSTGIEKQVEYLMTCIKDLCLKASSFGAADKIYVTIGGDFINSDNSKLTTTNGTPQDSLPSHTGLMLKGGFVLVKMIDLLRQVFKVVELIPSPGNHDRDTSISMYMFISAWYRNCPDVITNMNFDDIEKTNCHLRQYRKFGNNLLAFMHGDGSKLKQWPIIIANEAREIWGQTKHCILVTGHKHYRISQDIMGIQHIQVPSLASEDRWSTLNGYQSEKSISMILVDTEQGYMAELVSTIST